MALVSLKKRLITLLAEEIKEYLPQFEPYSSDYPMVIYACRDLEEWMKCTWDIKTNHGIHETLGQTLEHEPEVIRVFLTFWVGCWLEKWTERVKILLAKPEIPPNALKRVKEAKKIYRGMKHRNELKKMVIQRLICQGEICMPRVIAENLIVQEIAKRNRNLNGALRLVNLLPLDILNSVSYRISRLPKEKGPLIYLNIKPYTL